MFSVEFLDVFREAWIVFPSSFHSLSIHATLLMGPTLNRPQLPWISLRHFLAAWLDIELFKPIEQNCVDPKPQPSCPNHRRYAQNIPKPCRHVGHCRSWYFWMFIPKVLIHPGSIPRINLWNLPPLQGPQTPGCEIVGCDLKAAEAQKSTGLDGEMAPNSKLMFQPLVLSKGLEMISTKYLLNIPKIPFEIRTTRKHDWNNNICPKQKNQK